MRNILFFIAIFLGIGIVATAYFILVPARQVQNPTSAVPPRPIVSAPIPALAAQTSKFVIPHDALMVPVTVGAPTHTWSPLLGGVLWISSKASARAQARALSFYQGDVLLDIKATAGGFGYRFDQNTYEKNTMEYGYYSHDGTEAGEPTTLDDQFQIFNAPNAKFILHIPVPNESLALGSERFVWQTPEFYAAQIQYLFGKADDPSVYSVLPTSLDFFTLPNSKTFNFANLRARRGHPEPYRAEAVIFGEEPYSIEGWQATDGAGFGARIEAYRAQMRARGVMIPYGVPVSQLNPTDREWFKPLLSTLPAFDQPTYFDLYHYYSFVTDDDWLRSFPVAQRSEGFTNWWLPHSTWRGDFTKYLWIIQDTKDALKDRGVSLEKVKIGFGEHGITIVSPFKYNDMMGAIHWALWLSETMRYGTDWDSMWVLFGEGFSTAQVQYRNGALTKTPAFFVYEMANKFKGLTYLATDAQSPEGMAQNPEKQNVSFPYVIVRIFQNSATGNRELFVINQHPTKSAYLKGFENWNIVSWEELHGDTYDSGNPLDGSGALPIKTQVKNVLPSSLLTIDPISVNRIVLRQK